MVLSSTTQRKHKTTFICKKIFNTESIELFRIKLYEPDWEETETSTTPDDAYTTFLQKFIVLYDNHFPKRNIKLKAKNLKSLWITRGIKKTSKRNNAYIKIS